MRIPVSDVETPAPARPNGLTAWAPFVLQLILTLLALGALYGSLGGRLNLIEYRLQKIETKIGL